MFKKLIPGHARAYTIWIAIILAIVAFLKTNRWSAVLGAVFIVLGMFLADQATHLAQENHRAPPPTWIERMQQHHRWTFVIIGSILSVAGLVMIL